MGCRRQDTGARERPGFSAGGLVAGDTGASGMRGDPRAACLPQALRAGVRELSTSRTGLLPGPSLKLHAPSDLRPMAPFPSRSFETNLNTYKRLAIKLPDDQIVKVGDAV